MSERQPDIRGDVLPDEFYDNLSIIDIADIESAADWWDEYASSEWVGALDSEPINKD